MLVVGLLALPFGFVTGVLFRIPAIRAALKEGHRKGLREGAVLAAQVASEHILAPEAKEGDLMARITQASLVHDLEVELRHQANMIG